MCCLCLLEIFMTLVLEILSATTVCLYAGSADIVGGGHQCVVSFGIEHGLTKADGLWMVTIGYHRLLPELRYEDPACYFNYLPMQTKRRQRIGSPMNVQCVRCNNSRHTVEAP